MVPPMRRRSKYEKAGLPNNHCAAIETTALKNDASKLAAVAPLARYCRPIGILLRFLGLEALDTDIFTESGGHANEMKFAMEKEGARWCRWSSKPVWGP